jgi:membrane-bound metal-dependent hydrolase YbcI (DUF457 family)
VLGYTHCLSGLAAGVAAGSLALHLPAIPLAAFTAVTAAYSLAPDLDSCGSTESRSFGFATEAFAWLVGRISGGHRHGTHSVLGVAVFAGVAWIACLLRHTMPGRIALGVILAVGFASAMDALRTGGHAGNLLACGAAAAMAWTGYGLAVVPIAAGLGAATHLAGDALTRCGVPLCWPFTMREFHLTPRRLWFTTGHWPEHLVVTPLLVAALGFLLYRDTGASSLTQHLDLAAQSLPFVP